MDGFVMNLYSFLMPLDFVKFLSSQQQLTWGLSNELISL